MSKQTASAPVARETVSSDRSLDLSLRAKNKFGKGADEAEDVVEEAAETVEEKVEEAVEKAEEVVEEIKEEVEE